MAVKRPSSTVTSRAVYDPPIREAIEAGDLDRMRALLEEAKAVYKEQGDLKAAIAQLEAAIKATG